MAITAVALIGVLLDRFLIKSYKKRPEDRHWYLVLSYEFLPIMIVIMVVRTYLYEPYIIPSSSMYPALKTGDVIAVNKTSYDIKFPFSNLSLWELSHPERGDIAVFKYPLDNNTTFVKRIIGIPGDHMRWSGDNLFINGSEVKRDSAQYSGFPGRYNFERLGKERYLILRNDAIDSTKFTANSTYLLLRYQRETGTYADNGVDLNIQIPEGYYFVMGDFRDGSEDSRQWGLVARSEMVGRADYRVLSINNRFSWLTPWHKISFINSGRI